MPDANYHDHREAQERSAAGVSMNLTARAIHRELADRHAEMSTLIRRNERLRDGSDEQRLLVL